MWRPIPLKAFLQNGAGRGVKGVKVNVKAKAVCRGTALTAASWFTPNYT